MTGDWWGEQLITGGHPDDTLFLTDQAVVARRDFADRVRQVAGTLRSHGIEGGEAVAVQGRPSLTLLWTLMALWSCGAQVVLIDPWLVGPEVRALLDACRPRYQIRLGGVGALLRPFQDEYELIVEPRRAARLFRTDHDLVQFSSGVTGTPKIIGRRGGELLAELDAFAALDGMPDRGDRVLLLAPMTHSLGLIGGVLHVLRSGATAVFTRQAGTGALLGTAARTRATAVFGLPSQFARLSAVGARTRLEALRTAVAGGEALPVPVYERFADRFGVRIGQAYGLTEVGVVAADLSGGEPPPAVGRPVPGQQIRLRDGELLVRVPESPYLAGDADGRYADGWLSTGDLADRDPRTGALYLRGRRESVVTAGGVTLDLTRIEATLREHARVSDAVVVYDDEIEAHVVAVGRVAEAELSQWCRHRLDDQLVPRRFHLVPRIPRTPSGKFIRNPSRLRAAYVAADNRARTGRR